MYQLNRLKDLRKAKNMSQQELADKFGISQAAISDWESGNSGTTLIQMFKLCELFSVTPNQLLGIDEYVSPDPPPELKGARITFANGEVLPITQEELDFLTLALLKARGQKSQQGGNE